MPTVDTATDTIIDLLNVKRVRSSWDRCVASWYRLVHKPDRSASWMWFDGKHFSSLNRMKSNCTCTAAACSESDGQRDWFQTTAARDVVWHSWARNHDKLFCVQSVSECQFHMRSHDSVDAFLDCLPDWAQCLRHSQFLVDGLPLPGCRSIVYIR